MTVVAVLDYGIGNLRSAQKSFQHLGVEAHLTADPGRIRDADAVVLPGVGAFGPCMQALRASKLDVEAHAAVERGQPFMGICVGMQLLYEGSEETPDVAGLGILPGTVRLLSDTVKRPQMQWNVLDIVKASPLFDGLHDPAWVYFVHSFAADDPTNVIATCDYGGAVCAVVERDNVCATQFHPEKSSFNGLQLLANFVKTAAERTSAPTVELDA